MSLFPVCLNIENRLCAVIGGGAVAERKVRGLLLAGARVRVISPAMTPGLMTLHEEGRIEWMARSYQGGDLEKAFLVIAATDDHQVQTAIFAEANQRNIFVNVVDTPEFCTFTLPAVVRQGDLMIAVSTNGKSPALAKHLRIKLEGMFGPEYAVLLDILGQVRSRVLAEGRSQEENEKLFLRLLHPEILAWVREEKWDEVQHHIHSVLGAGYPFEVTLPNGELVRRGGL